MSSTTNQNPDDTVGPTPTSQDELRKQARHIFVNRTHKFPNKKIEIIQEPETQNQRFILAPYDLTVEKVMALVKRREQALLRELLKQKVPVVATNLSILGNFAAVPASVIEAELEKI